MVLVGREGIHTCCCCLMLFVAVCRCLCHDWRTHYESIENIIEYMNVRHVSWSTNLFGSGLWSKMTTYTTTYLTTSIKNCNEINLKNMRHF